LQRYNNPLSQQYETSNFAWRARYQMPRDPQRIRHGCIHQIAGIIERGYRNDAHEQKRKHEINRKKTRII
jgi:hypothetical protein